MRSIFARILVETAVVDEVLDLVQTIPFVHDICFEQTAPPEHSDGIGKIALDCDSRPSIHYSDIENLDDRYCALELNSLKLKENDRLPANRRSAKCV